MLLPDRHPQSPQRVPSARQDLDPSAALQRCLDALVVRVARFHAVDPDAVRRLRRGPAPVVRARQIVMYLAHVALGLGLTQVAVLLERDRSSAAHACRVIEDLRDDPALDAALQAFEQSLLGDRRLG